MPESFAGITVPEGEPGALRSAAGQFGQVAGALGDRAGGIGALPGQLASWQGPASAAFAATCRQHAQAAQGAASAVTGAGLAAGRYAEELDQAQDDAREAIRDARDATERIKTLTAQIAAAKEREAAARSRAAAAGDEFAASAAVGAPSFAAEDARLRAESEAADAADDQARLARRLEEARDDLERAKRRGQRAERAGRDADRAAAAAFGGVGAASFYVAAPGAAATAAVARGARPTMAPPLGRPSGGVPLSDAASGDGYRTHGDPLRFHRQYVADRRAAEARRRAAQEAEDDGGWLSDLAHGTLDGIGLLPVVGEPADLANAGLYALEGDKANAALSLAATAPVAGAFVTGGKYVKKASDAFDEASQAARTTQRAPSPGHSDPYRRPSSHRDGVRDRVWQLNTEPSTGRVRDPLTGQFMSRNKPWDMGHRPRYEHRKHQESARARGIDRHQFLDEYNDPSKYRPELPRSNRSHSGEDKSDRYDGP
jgi:uncharacterized protein YukE